MFFQILDRESVKLAAFSVSNVLTLYCVMISINIIPPYKLVCTSVCKTAKFNYTPGTVMWLKADFMLWLCLPSKPITGIRGMRRPQCRPCDVCLCLGADCNEM